MPRMTPPQYKILCLYIDIGTAAEQSQEAITDMLESELKKLHNAYDVVSMTSIGTRLVFLLERNV